MSALEAELDAGHLAAQRLEEDRLRLSADGDAMRAELARAANDIAGLDQQTQALQRALASEREEKTEVARWVRLTR
jgi:hypothetical protein